MKSNKDDTFSWVFFDLIRILEGKDSDPSKDFLAKELVKYGFSINLTQLQVYFQSLSVEEVAQEVTRWYCYKSIVNGEVEERFILNDVIDLFSKHYIAPTYKEVLGKLPVRAARRDRQNSVERWRLATLFYFW